MVLSVALLLWSTRAIASDNMDPNSAPVPGAFAGAETGAPTGARQGVVIGLIGIGIGITALLHKLDGAQDHVLDRLHRGDVSCITTGSSYEIHHVFGWVDAWKRDVTFLVRVGMTGHVAPFGIARIFHDVRNLHTRSG